MLEAEVARFAEEAERELGPEVCVLVACSGGLDSVVLARLVADRLGARRVTIGHVDHAVRPGSERDVEGVRRLAERLGLRFESERLAPGSDDEARLRRERYDALERMRARSGAELILTAHTRDDQAETVLLTLIRSTAVSALAGMPTRRDRVWRPLLRVPRSALKPWASSKGLTWVEDPSNREPRYLRNRIRKELMPLLESRYRAGLSARLAALTETVRAAEGLGEPVAPGPPAASPSPPDRPFELPSVTVSWCPQAPAGRPSGLEAAWIDARVVPRPRIRRPKSGDRVKPIGMTGHKKLQDVFVDAKIPRAVRASYPVVVCADTDTILWLPRLVRSGHALVDPQTRAVWRFEC